MSLTDVQRKDTVGSLGRGKSDPIQAQNATSSAVNSMAVPGKQHRRNELAEVNPLVWVLMVTRHDATVTAFGGVLRHSREKGFSAIDTGALRKVVLRNEYLSGNDPCPARADSGQVPP